MTEIDLKQPIVFVPKQPSMRADAYEELECSLGYTVKQVKVIKSDAIKIAFRLAAKSCGYDLPLHRIKVVTVNNKTRVFLMRFRWLFVASVTNKSWSLQEQALCSIGRPEFSSHVKGGSFARRLYEHYRQEERSVSGKTVYELIKKALRTVTATPIPGMFYVNDFRVGDQVPDTNEKLRNAGINEVTLLNAPEDPVLAEIVFSKLKEDAENLHGCYQTALKRMSSTETEEEYISEAAGSLDVHVKEIQGTVKGIRGAADAANTILKTIAQAEKLLEIHERRKDEKNFGQALSQF